MYQFEEDVLRSLRGERRENPKFIALSMRMLRWRGMGNYVKTAAAAASFSDDDCWG